MINKLIDMLYNHVAQLPEARIFYDQAIEEIESSFLAPQVHFLLKEQGCLDQLPLFFQVRLKQQCQEVLYQNLLIRNQTEKVLKQLDAVSLEAIPLKGAYFAEKYFGHLGARATSDIDLLIKEKDLHHVIETVKAMGFQMEEEPIPGHFHCSFSKAIPGSSVPLTVEVHWNLLRESTSNLKMADFWYEAVPLEGYQSIKMLSDYHTFYAICLHGWRHNLDSPKHVVDIIQLIVRLQDKLDYTRLFKDAKADQTWKRIKRTLSIVYQEHPWLSDIRDFPQKTEKRFTQENRIMDYLRFIDYQFLSYDTARHSFIELFHWLVPNKFELTAELGSDSREVSYLYQLVHLYKKRGTSALQAIMFH